MKFKGYAIALIWLSVSLATGCGGGGNINALSQSYKPVSGAQVVFSQVDEPQVQAGSGSLKLKINWPSRSQQSGKYIPAASDHIAVIITGSGLNNPRTTIIPYGQSTTTITSLPAGDKSAELQAVDSSDNILAHRKVNFTIVSGQTTQTTGIHMGVTIEDSGLTPQTITVPAGTLLYWYNNGTQAYAFSAAPAPFDGGTIEPDTYASFSFSDVGTFVYSAGAFAGTVEVTGAPRIDSLSPLNGLIGSSVTLQGAGFGIEQGDSSVEFSPNLQAAITSWSKTRIICTVPAGAATGPVRVNTALGTSNLNHSFTVNCRITGLNPAHGRINSAVTLSGDHFGATQGTSSVKFYNLAEAAITFWSESQIVCSVPASATTGDVTVRVAGIDSNTGQIFTVTPQITAYSPEIAAAGEKVTLLGNHFGATQGTSALSVAGVDAGTANTWSDSQIVFTVPEGALTGTIVVTVSGYPSNDDYTITLVPVPHITGISPAEGANVGDTVTLTGTGFGAYQGQASQILFNGYMVYTIPAWSDTQIVCTVPEGATTGEVTVTNDYQRTSPGFIYEILGSWEGDID